MPQNGSQQEAGEAIEVLRHSLEGGEGPLKEQTAQVKGRQEEAEGIQPNGVQSLKGWGRSLHRLACKSGSQGWLTSSSGGKQTAWELCRPALKPMQG